MFNLFKPQITAEDAGQSVVYDVAIMVSNGDLSIEALSNCNNVEDVRTILGSDFNEKFIDRFFAGEEFLCHHRKLNEHQRQVIAKAVLVASKSMRKFIDRMVLIYLAQKAVTAGGGKAHHISWRFPKFNEYESEFKPVKDVLTEAFPR